MSAKSVLDVGEVAGALIAKEDVGAAGAARTAGAGGAAVATGAPRATGAARAGGARGAGGGGAATGAERAATPGTGGGGGGGEDTLPARAEPGIGGGGGGGGGGAPLPFAPFPKCMTKFAELRPETGELERVGLKNARGACFQFAFWGRKR